MAMLGVGGGEGLFVIIDRRPDVVITGDWSVTTLHVHHDNEAV